jgi:ADP-heptose:LPS heptosyltransferase
LERTTRVALLRCALSLLAKEGGPLPDWDERPYRILFIRYDRLGDMVMCTGILGAIADAHPQLIIDVLTTPSNAPALENLPFINSVLLHERGEHRSYLSVARQLASSGYDVVIDGLVWRPSVNSYTTRLMIASRARWRIGSGGRPNDFAYNVPVEPPRSRYAEHHIDHLARLARPFGLGPRDADWRPRLVLTAAEQRAAEDSWRSVAPRGGLRVLVNLSAGHPERRWPDERFAALLASLRLFAPGASVIVVALPTERESAVTLADSIGATPHIPTVRELFALVASADLVITPDTAVAHVCAAFQRPTLALLRREAEYHIWVPYGTPGRNVFGDDEQTLKGLPVDRVVAALRELVNELAEERQRAKTRERAVAAS